MSNLFPDITGVLYEEEQSKLHEIAKTTTHPIVNIGVYQGLSTAQLASGTKQSVYAIDIWDERPAGYVPTKGDLMRGYHLGETQSIFLENMKKHGLTNVIRIKGNSKVVGKTWDTPIGMLFIDGDHRYEAALSDYNLFAKHIISGGYLAIHDYHLQGVKKLIDEVVVPSGLWTDIELTETLWVGKRNLCTTADAKPPMTYWIRHHNHKGVPIEKALVNQAWQYSDAPDIALFDIARSKPIERRFRRGGATLVVYPHTAIAGWWYDGVLELPSSFRALLVVGEGQKEVQQIITPNIRVETIGWGYCPILPFQKPKAVKKITFAPIHPIGGNLRQEAKDANTRVYKRLLELGEVEITMRVIGKLEDNGVWESPNVIINNANPDGSYAEIDAADLVIGEGMYLSLAVARGKPAIGMNQYPPCRANTSECVPKRWNEYNHLQAYPIDFDDGDLTELIDKALDESQVSNWKKRFIGEQLQPEHLSNVLKDIRNEHAKQREQ